MRDWHQWWNEYPAQVQQGEVFVQVGRTVGGTPTGEQDLIATSEAILSALQLLPTDVVLDLCCGNGIISERIAPHCGSLIGVDFSEPLIQIAKSRTSGIKFVVSDVTILNADALGVSRIDAACLSSAFQYFDEAMTSKMLGRLKDLSMPGFRIFIESIPDIDRITAHYNTPERMAAHLRRKMEGIEQFQNWWNSEQITAVAKAEGFACEVLRQGTDRVRGHYQFDALLTLVT